MCREQRGLELFIRDGVLFVLVVLCVWSLVFTLSHADLIKEQQDLISTLRSDIKLLKSASYSQNRHIVSVDADVSFMRLILENRMKMADDTLRRPSRRKD